MQKRTQLRILLAISGLIAAGIGALILMTPVQFHAGYGTDLGANASLLSEVRAPGGALFALGLFMLLGVVRRRLLETSTAVAATVYLAYGLSRLLSFGLDGRPDSGLLVATAFELVLGTACAWMLLRMPLAERVAR
ncbi:MAG: DUF4345 domain-containing protein [Planctomycetota bacterium]